METPPAESLSDPVIAGPARRPLPPLRLLGVFEAVARERGVARAAAALNVTQPAVSQSLRALEDFVGATLVDRRARPLRLTPAGAVLEAAVRDGLGRIADALDAIALRAGEDDSAVTLACGLGVATHWLMPRLEDFYRRYEEIVVHVATLNDGAPALAPGRDICIRFGDGRWRDGEVVPLFGELVTPVATPERAEALRATPDGWMSAPRIHVAFPDPRWTTWDDYLAAIGRPSAPAQASLRFSNNVQATQAALAGRGVLLGWRSITGALVRDGRLAPVGAPTLTAGHAFYAVAAHARRAAPAVAALIEWLRTAGADTGPPP